MSEAFICEGTRTPIGKFGGSLSSIRTDGVERSLVNVGALRAEAAPAVAEDSDALPRLVLVTMVFL